jgi:hypothetical protein
VSSDEAFPSSPTPHRPCPTKSAKGQCRKYRELLDYGPRPPAVFERHVREVAVRMVPEVEDLVAPPAGRLLELLNRALEVNHALLELGHPVPQLRLVLLVVDAQGSRLLREETRLARLHDHHVEVIHPIVTYQEAHTSVPTDNHHDRQTQSLLLLLASLISRIRFVARIHLLFSDLKLRVLFFSFCTLADCNEQYYKKKLKVKEHLPRLLFVSFKSTLSRIIVVIY